MFGKSPDRKRGQALLPNTEDGKRASPLFLAIGGLGCAQAPVGAPAAVFSGGLCGKYSLISGRCSSDCEKYSMIWGRCSSCAG